MKWDKELDGKSLEIAQNKAQRLRVMAGPGTGKSFAMKRRITRLIEEDKIDPKEILAVTFTRTAAADLKKEFINLGIPGGENIKSMTLHSFCFGLLNEKDVFEKLKRTPRPLKSFSKRGSPQFELSPVLADINLMGNFGNKSNKFKLIKAFEACWAQNQDESLWSLTNKEKEFKNALENWLKSHGSMLIGELVPLALQFLQNNPASDLLMRFKHIVVDEYQDLNKAEQTLIDVLGKNCAISIVGDVDQSIYSFRCAHPDGIVDFANRHTGVVDVQLKECRRCSKRIVGVADALIRENHAPENKARLIPLNDKTDGSLAIVQWASANEEAKGISEFIKHLITNKNYLPRDILILSPRRLLGYQLRDLIQQNQISVHSFFHEEALEEDDAQKAVSVLNLLAIPDDQVALRFSLGIGSSNWRAPQYKSIRDHAFKEGKSTVQVLNEIISNQLVLMNVAQIRKTYTDLRRTIDTLKDKTIKEIVDILFPDGNDHTKILRETACLFMEKNSGATVLSLWEHIETVLTQPEMPDAGDFVRIMSLHKSKGLTSKVTIITSCIQGLVPTLEKGLSQQDQNYKLQEQRRLFYVAMTRAQELLIMSSFTSVPLKLVRQIGAKFNHRRSYAETIASQFLSEFAAAAPNAQSGSHWLEGNFQY